MAWPLDERTVQHAVSNILEHSEREPDLNQLYATFVDPGILIHLDNNNNQIVFGRRGTGKTHVLKVLQREAVGAADQLPVYIDMRTLGSSALWEHRDRPASVRVGNLLEDVLGPIHTALLEYATRPSTAASTTVLESVTALAATIDKSVTIGDHHVDDRAAPHSDRAALADAITPASGVTMRGDEQDTARRALAIVREASALERILFREIGGALNQALADAGIKRLLILFDEWNAIPDELQPLLAEFLKRTFFPYGRVTVKIAAIDYRCVFGVPLTRDNTLGFELTGDVSASLDLDEFYVFDRDEDVALSLFAELIFRHVAAECDRYWLAGDSTVGRAVTPASMEAVYDFAKRHHGRPGYYLDQRLGVSDPEQFRNSFFDGEKTFAELARAGEGVARDFLRLFHDACFDTIRRHRTRIDIRSVRQVARDWYAKEKIVNVDAKQAEVLRRIMAEVMGRHRARSFLFEQGIERTDMIRSLMDLRLIHLVKRGFTPHDDESGTHYNVYTLDYGSYVHALGTDRAPTGDFAREFPKDADVVVPFHDDRAIRRLILPREMLEPGAA